MNLLFDSVAADLWRSLGLDDPQPLDGLLSLEVSEQVIHVTEQPAGHLLMFGHLASLHPDDIDTVMQENLFSHAIHQPLAARVGIDGSWVFWNRQSLDHCETSAMHQQLEALVDVLERRSGRIG